VRKVQVKVGEGLLQLSDDVERFFEKRVTRFGTGAKIDCPKEFLGRRVYVIVCRD
jgi:putative transposon-encoded protein